jgi:hypothetical protein
LLIKKIRIHVITILPFLYAFEITTQTLREDHGVQEDFLGSLSSCRMEKVQYAGNAR